MTYPTHPKRKTVRVGHLADGKSLHCDDWEDTVWRSIRTLAGVWDPSQSADEVKRHIFAPTMNHYERPTFGNRQNEPV